MAEFGMVATNDLGRVVIDSSFINLNFTQRGVANNRQWVRFQERAADSLVFLKLPPAATTSAPVCGMVDYTSGSPSNAFGYTGRYNGGGFDSVPASVEYVIASIGPPIVPPPDHYGLKVWNGNGELCFNSLYSQPRIVTAAQGTFGADGNTNELILEMPDDSQDFWISAPMGGLLADSWNDNGVEIMDISSVRMSWQSKTRIRVQVDVQYQYPTGWGGLIVTHQDCFGATVSVLAARI